MKPVYIYKVLRTTAGGFHSWCNSNFGIIRKPNNKISLELPEIEKEITIIEEKPKTAEEIKSLWQKIKEWFLSFFK